MLKKIFLGTYTRRVSEGIYSVYLNEEKKVLENLNFEHPAKDPSYLTFSKDRQELFAITKGDKEDGGFFSSQLETESYELQDLYTGPGAPPCYISFDDDKRLIFTSNYHQGKVSVYAISQGGKISLVDVHEHTGSGPHENQENPHAHYFDWDPEKNFLISCDLGTDEVHSYRLNDDHSLTVQNILKVPGGTGPRHIVFHPDKNYAYLVGELSSEVLSLKYDPTEGRFEILQSLPTIPDDHTSFNSGAAIRISNDGRFVYYSNRGHDSIAVFEVLEDGLLAPVEIVPSEGKTPRDFNLDPSNQFLVVGHQDEDVMTLFERDGETGKLTLLQKDFYAPEVINVEFL